MTDQKLAVIANWRTILLILLFALVTVVWMNFRSAPIQKTPDLNTLAVNQAKLSLLEPTLDVPEPLLAVSPHVTEASSLSVKQKGAETSTDIDSGQADIFTPELEADLLALLPKASEAYNAQPIKRSPVPLWQSAPHRSTQRSSNKLPKTPVSAAADKLGELQEGDRVALPDSVSGADSGTITYRRLLANGITVLKFGIDDGNALTGGQIVKGDISTDINVVTEEGAYTVSIDNQTGEGILIDDADLKRLYQPDNDAIALPPRDPAVEPDMEEITSNT